MADDPVLADVEELDEATDPLYAVDLMVNDAALQGRIRAAAAKKKSEGFTVEPDGNVWSWASAHSYEVASAPGWGADYQYALDTMPPPDPGTVPPTPGSKPDVITDAQILSQVQTLLEAEAPG